MTIREIITLISLLFLLFFTSTATAQAARNQPAQAGGNQPAQTVRNQPAQAGGNQPAQTVRNQPAQAGGNQPAQTVRNQPAQAGGNKPAQPVRNQPAQPVRNYQPAQPGGNQPAKAGGNQHAGGGGGGTLDVVAKYGAKADGRTDLSGPLLSAWKDACASTAPSKIVIPNGNYFLSRATLQGPCKAPVTVQVGGIIKAPPDPSASKDGTWVCFSRVQGFTMNGGGTFDGQGATTWSKNNCKNRNCPKFPYNLRFDFVTNGHVHDITSKDSKDFNANLLGCKNFTFERFTISNPENSLHTDGIHIGRSDGVRILNSDMKTGGDCISFGDGSKNVDVNGIRCGPGHGISIGSLGKYNNEEPISGIFVKNCIMTKTLTGARIKTWPASYPGSASDIHFEDMTMTNVGNPIVIDQQYCPWNKCDLKNPSRVKLSNISFKNIRGTASSREVVRLICSSGMPCQGVQLSNIDLTFNGPGGPAISQCLNVSPQLSGKQNPAICAPRKGPVGRS